MVSLSRCCLASRYKCTTTIYDTASKRSNERTNEQQQTHNRSAHMNTDGPHTHTDRRIHIIVWCSQYRPVYLSRGFSSAHTTHRSTDRHKNQRRRNVCGALFRRCPCIWAWFFFFCYSPLYVRYTPQQCAQWMRARMCYATRYAHSSLCVPVHTNKCIDRIVYMKPCAWVYA